MCLDNNRRGSGIVGRLRLDVHRNRGEREGAGAEYKAREVRFVRVVERARNHRAQRAAHT